jgi:hypothetical protein
MTPKEHVVYGAAASAALAPVFGPKVAYFFAGSILIDVDHYIDYLYFGRFRSWGPSRMFRFHAKLARAKYEPKFCALEAFHTAEFFLGVLAVGLFFRSPEILLILGGMTFHLFLDLLRLHQSDALTVRALSFIEYAVRARNMRRSGIDPEAVFFKAFAESETPDREEEAGFSKSMEIQPGI